MAATLSQLLLLEVIAGAAITIVILVATWLIVRGGLRPLEPHGRDGARRRQRPEPARRAGHGATEVGRLGLAINDMLGQLEAAFAERAANEQRLRHFVSDASHELRTPLTSIGGYAELLRRNPDMTEQDVMLATRRIEEEVAAHGRARRRPAAAGAARPGPAAGAGAGRPRRAGHDAVADARAADPARTVTARVEAPVRVIGDDMRLRQVLGNLVRNALVHTPPGTPVEVALRRDGDTRRDRGDRPRPGHRRATTRIASSSASTAPTRGAAATRGAAGSG